MKLIDEFVKKVLSTNESFVIHNNDRGSKMHYSFMQCRVGNGKYIYGKHEFNENALFNIEDTYEIVAIVSNKKIYLTNIYFFGSLYSHPGSLPENVERLDCEKENEYAKNSLFPKFYDSLDITGPVDANFIRTCRDAARENLLYCKDKSFGWEEIYPLEDLFSEQDKADMLCGLINIDEEAKKRFEVKRESYTAKKQYQQKVKEFMDDPSTAEKWELEIARALKETDAQTVTVEFELNGKIASGKLSPRAVMNALVYKHCFRSYNFANGNLGKKLFQELGASDDRLGASDDRHSNNSITCSNITKITYNRKDLYVRNKTAT